MSDRSIGIAFPLHEGDRIKIRNLAKMAGIGMPTIYPDSTAMPCTVCDMTLAVGPRLTGLVNGGLADVYCPVCGTVEAQKRAAGTGVPIQVTDLGNPNSGIEK